jgi:uncharacterized membrane protein YbhN (UPF0104 family)
LLPRLSVASTFVAFFLSLLLVLAHAVGAYFVALSLHVIINPMDWIAIHTIVSVVQILPLTVGGLGVRESAFGLILSLYAIPATQAIAFSLIGFVLVMFLTAVCWLTLSSAVPVKGVAEVE